MPNLIFAAADVRRLVEHTLRAPEQAEYMVDFDGKTGQAIMAKPEAPAVILVHDQGVYLMSNGTPPDLLKEGEPRRYCAYAEGCHPEKNDDWWDTARDLVGGDDFAETLPWARQMKEALDKGATHIVVKMSTRRLELTFRFPRAKAKAKAHA